MNITDIRVRLIKGEGKMRAVASITIDNEFAVHDIKIIEGQSGLFLAMPSRKVGESEHRDIAHPINAQARDELQRMVIEAYERVLEEDEISGEKY
jgi:stage V sporulation protein G